MPNIDSIPLKARELQGLLWLKSAVKAIESNWAKESRWVRTVTLNCSYTLPTLPFSCWLLSFCKMLGS